MRIRLSQHSRRVLLAALQVSCVLLQAALLLLVRDTDFRQARAAFSLARLIPAVELAAMFLIAYIEDHPDAPSAHP